MPVQKSHKQGKVASWHWIVPLCAFLALFLYKLNAFYPYLGHDYAYFIERLLAGRAHFAMQGLAPYRYTPYFCGGFPNFGNPQGLYYSLPQFLTVLFNPWIAVQAATILSIIAGYFGWLLFAKDVMHLPRHWRHVFALVIIANGFTFLHAAAGHVPFHTFPLVGFLAWMFFHPEKETKKLLAIRSALFALITALMIYAGGFYVLIFMATGFALFTPFYLLLQKEPQKMFRLLLRRGICFATGALLISLSKIVAVYSLMQAEPRIIAFEQIPASTSFIYLLTALWSIPQHSGLFEYASWEIHEKSALISPITLIGLAVLPMAFFTSKRLKENKEKNLFLFLYSVLIVIFFSQLVSGSGFFVTPLKFLPVFKSLHAPTRFLYILSVFFSIIAVWNLGRFIDERLPHKAIALSWLAAWITVGAFQIGYPRSTLVDVGYTYNYQPVHTLLKTSPLPAPAQNISYDTPYEGAHGNTQMMLAGGVSLKCYEPLFGYDRTSAPATVVLQKGLVADTTNDHFNLMNPVCYQYPKENNCAPGDAITLDDKENLENFRRGLPVTWETSLLQQIADVLSFVALLVVITILVISLRRPRT